MRFRDRVEAGRQLAETVRLAHLDGEAVVLGLPRGGVPVAAQVAEALAAPLDVIVVRKLGVPSQPELAMGAIGEGGIRVENIDVMRSTALSEVDLDASEERERSELERRAREYRNGRPRIDLRGRVAVIVDDGIATGSTARAACQVARAQGATDVVVAAPVASRLALAALSSVADDVLVISSPESFFAVGEWYQDFSPTSDAEVVDLLRRSAGSSADRAIDQPMVSVEEDVSIPGKTAQMLGLVATPSTPAGTVVFAHGSGSGRQSPRNRMVADLLNQGGFATVLVDLLTPREARDRSNVFDIELLAERLQDVGQWVSTRADLAGSALGYFGASTGAAAALWAAAQPDSGVSALVLRGGRPDLAAPVLSAVRAPTLLIVGGRDEAVLSLNEAAQAELRSPNRLLVVPGATHLFEEAGALNAVARHAREWFTAHLRPPDLNGDADRTT